MKRARTGRKWALLRAPGRAKVVLATAVVLQAPPAVTGAVFAQVRLTQQEALRVAFPEPATIERRTAFLSEQELESARGRAGFDVEVEQSVVTYYVGWSGDQPLGVAYFDAHRVRTLPEVLMIVVSPESRIRRIEILKFSEPPEYRAPESWLAQFEDEPLTESLNLERSIVNITGATLTSQAVTEAARRVLALHQVIRPFAADGGGEDR